MNRIQRVLVLVACFIAVAAACGSDDDDASTAAVPATPTATQDGSDAAGAGSNLGSNNWRLVTADVDGDQLTLLVSHPVTIRADGSRVRGTAACNGYGGTIVTGDVLFEGFEVTEMACDPASAMTLESA
ncbi:MAG: META domain-containing protein, partial [Acidimicrobiales bacterium]